MDKNFNSFAISVDNLVTPNLPGQGPIKRYEHNEENNENLDVKQATTLNDPKNKAIIAKKELRESNQTMLNDKN